MDSISATLIGGAIGGLIGSIGSFFVSWNQSRSIARAKFRGAFIPTLHILKPLNCFSPEDVSDTLVLAYPNHDLAVAQIKPFLSLGEREAFNSAWYAYYGQEGYKSGVHFEKYSTRAIGGHATKSQYVFQKELNQLAHDRLLELLTIVDG